MSAPIVQAPCGTVRGIERPGSLAFLGIPYAEAPVGELRFAAPVPRATFLGTFDATAFGATPQRRSPFLVSTIPEPCIPGEDTLNLNVFTPDTNGALPVMVYIHGGGYIGGSHVGAWFDGASYNRDGVVIVTISYRLGFEGFGWIEDAPRNRGLCDMVCALEWVRDNIAAFGGDPSKVTISGQSAGGGAVLSLLAMPMAQGLFHRVIAHSPVIGVASRAEHASKGRAFAAEFDVAPTAGGWSSISEDDVLDRQLAGFMQGGQGQVHPMVPNLMTCMSAVCDITMAWGPALDDDTMPESPYELWRSGFNADVELLIGTTRDEFYIPMISPPLDKAIAWLDSCELPGPYVAWAQELVARGEVDPIARLVTAVEFRRGVLDIAATRSHSTAHTWAYEFAHTSSVTGVALHCLELPFTWDCLQAEGVEAVLGPNQPQDLADAMHGAWVAFITTGNPGWPEVSETSIGRVFGAHDDIPAYADVLPMVAALPKR